MISAVQLPEPTAPVTTINDIDNCFEREGRIEVGTGVPLVTHNMILKFFWKKTKKEEYNHIIKGRKDLNLVQEHHK